MPCMSKEKLEKICVPKEVFWLQSIPIDGFHKITEIDCELIFEYGVPFNITIEGRNRSFESMVYELV